MPEENEKVEDFMSLWKKKSEDNTTPSIIGDTINQIDMLKRENEELRRLLNEPKG